MNYGAGYGNAKKDKMRRASSIKSNGSKKRSWEDGAKGGAKGGPKRPKPRKG